MTELVDKLIHEPRSLTEQLAGRPAAQKIFISSKMRGGVFVVERREAAGAVDSTAPLAEAWWWERNSNAGPYCAAAVCLRQAATSDGLILLVGDELTPLTLDEYRVASENGATPYIFIDERVEQNAATQAFIEEQRDGPAVTRNFANASELQTHITNALCAYAVDSVRRRNFAQSEGLRRRRRGVA